MPTHQAEQEFGSAVVAFVEGLRGRFDDRGHETALDFAGHGEWELAIALLRQAVKKRRLRLTDEEATRLDELEMNPAVDQAYLDSVRDFGFVR